MGAVASHGPVDVRGPDGVVASPGRGVRRGSSGLWGSGSSGYRTGVAAHAGHGPAPCAAPPRCRGVARRPRPRPAARVARPVAGRPPLRGGAPHGAEVTVPGRIPGTRQALADVLSSIGAGGVRRRVPRRRARGRVAGERMPPVVDVPPGVDSERLRPITAAARRKARRRTGPARRGAPRRERRAAWCRARGWTCSSSAAAGLVPSFPDLAVAIAGAGRDPGPARGAGRLDAGLRCGCSAGSTTTSCPGSTGRPTSSSWPAATAGSVSSRRASGSCSWRRPACGVAQVAGRSGGADEAVVHGETGLVVGDPPTPARWPSPAPAAVDDDRRRSRWGGPPGAGWTSPSATGRSHIGWPRPCRTWKADCRRRPPREAGRGSERK